jgi:hypothetical protein
MFRLLLSSLLRRCVVWATMGHDTQLCSLVFSDTKLSAAI